MGEPYDFNEDDLINDYVDDWDEDGMAGYDTQPPPPAGMDIPEEFDVVQEQTINTDNDKGTSSASVSAPLSSDNTKTAIVVIDEEEERKKLDQAVIAGIQKAADAAQCSQEHINVTRASSDTVKSKKRIRDKYEPYTNQNSWRSNTHPTEEQQKTRDEQTVERWNRALAQRRKQKSSSKSGGGGKSSGGISADEQLVTFVRNESFMKRTTCVTPPPSSVKMDCTAHSSSFNVSVSVDGGKVTSNPISGEDSLALTCGDDRRVYVRCRSRATSPKSKMPPPAVSLLGIPMAQLLRRAELIERRQILFRTRRLARLDRSSSSTMIDPATVRISASRNSEGQNSLWVDKHAPLHFSHLLSEERTNRETLRALRQWDPYVFGTVAPPRPTYIQNFLDQQKAQREQQQNNNKSSNKTTDNNDHDHNTSPPWDIRPPPSHRVILLCGPPGVGKTTLAHIVAKHAGYRPLEINASDECTASILYQRITQAMESQSVVGALIQKTDKNGNIIKPKPNCLILDEIDGMIDTGGGGSSGGGGQGGGKNNAIQGLLDLIKADMPPPSKYKVNNKAPLLSNTDNNDKSSTSKSNKKSKTVSAPYLKRPMILICNHKFTPALRSILPFCKVLDVRPPTHVRLVGRLQSVLGAETLCCPSGKLQNLVVDSGGDIRSCLYTIQMAAAQAREAAYLKHEAKQKRQQENNQQQQNGGSDENFEYNQIHPTSTVVDISQSLSSTLGTKKGGLKDRSSDLSGVLTCVFRKNALSQRLNREGLGCGKRSVEGVMDVTEYHGDVSKTLDTIFTNINATSGLIDPTLDRTSTAHEYLSSADILRSNSTTLGSNNTGDSYGLQNRMYPVVAASVHILCHTEATIAASAAPTSGSTTSNSGQLQFHSKEMYDCHFRKQGNAALLRRFAEGLSPQMRGGSSTQSHSLVCDLVPWSMDMLMYGGGKCLSRAVSSVEMLAAKELEVFRHHVSVLRCLGLTYKRDMDDGLEDAQEGNRRREMRMEPGLDRLVVFGKNSAISPSSNFDRDATEELKNGNVVLTRKKIIVPDVLKELLAHSANVERMKERELDAAKKKAESSHSISQKDGTNTPSKKNYATLKDEERTRNTMKKFNDHAKDAAISNSKASHLRNKAASSTCFLFAAAAKVKAAKVARRKAAFHSSNRDGSHDDSKESLHSINDPINTAVARNAISSPKRYMKLSNTGSGIPFDSVMRYKYQKGFTQAVRTSCSIDDLL
mmetsp:Transcript_42269/g.49395  ORF Transcript_42269/g.49395 Transcript_42269/m.49395 type:complete len:1228 (+) Transcript_42269:91-3774(+)